MKTLLSKYQVTLKLKMNIKYVCYFVFIRPILGNRYGPGVIP